MRGSWFSRHPVVALKDPQHANDYRALLKQPGYWIGNTPADVRIALDVSDLERSFDELKALLEKHLAAHAAVAGET